MTVHGHAVVATLSPWYRYPSSAVPDTTQVDEVETDTDLPPKRKRVSTQTHRTTTRTPLLTLSGHNHPVTGVAWVGEEEVVSAGWDHCIRVWDVSSGVNTATLVSEEGINMKGKKPVYRYW